ncbi:PPOX class F420-dependent oxidoreductase [Kitasatospora sp. NPDC002040]|uniref:PPOX class F420-dependent oxidoreductase n=1 Tax=Kitasatospora sp. NPDC002040 TaxID=3154661 RepID=UPI003316C28B
MALTEQERAYLAGQPLGRLATVGPDGGPQVRPVSFRLNPDDTVDIGGPKLSESRKYRNLQANPLASFVVDDFAPADDPHAPGWGRGIELRGRAELLTGVEPPQAAGFFSDEVIRIRPDRVISWNLERRGSAARNVSAPASPAR